MKKLLLAVAVIIISAVSANAQTNFSIAGNLGYGTYTGASVAYGGDLQVDIPATTGLKITVSGGYENYSLKFTIGTTTYKSNAGFIPLLAGAKFNLSTNLYGHAQIGYGVATASGGSGGFAYAPSIGYMFSKNFDASVKYLAISNGGTLGAVIARLAYTFGK